ncbi:OmpP1/FadL family transporter [Marilutibacter aestuarii]|nr:outer membrane protein transport protein [Lysobacter aestuarii]
MQHADRIIRLSALALGITGALAVGQVHASGFQLKENSAKALGNAFAGAGVRTDDSSVVTNNPASMTQLQGTTTVQVDVTVVDLNYEADGVSGTDVLGQPLTGGNGGQAGDVTPVPAFSVVHRFDDTGAAIGAMVSAPFGLKTEYDRDWVGRYYAATSDVQIVDLTLAGALDITDRFSVGVGAIFSHADVTLSKSVDFGTALFGNPATRPLPFARPQAADGFADVQGDGTGFGWLVGANLRPTDKLTLGLSHRSEIDYELDGDADWTVPANVRAVFDSNPMTRVLFNDGGVTANLTTPAITTLDANYQFTEAFSMAATVSRTNWESLREVRIDFDNPDPDSAEEFDWQNTTFWSIGGEYKLNDAWTLRAGYAQDETPTRIETRTPRLPDADRNWYSLGATWALSDAFEMSFGYTYIQPKDPKIDIVTPPAAGGQRLAGDFDGDANLFAISGQYRF